MQERNSASASGLLVALHMMGWMLQADGGALLRVRALGWPRGHMPRVAPVLGTLVCSRVVRCAAAARPACCMAACCTVNR
jgi:hypothetical protein